MPSNWYHNPPGNTNTDHTDDVKVHYEAAAPSTSASGTNTGRSANAVASTANTAFANAYDTSHLTHNPRTHGHTHPTYLTYATAYHPATAGIVFDPHRGVGLTEEVMGYEAYNAAAGVPPAEFEYPAAAPAHRSNSNGSYGNGGNGGSNVQQQEYYDPYHDNNQATATYFYDTNARVPVPGPSNPLAVAMQQYSKQSSSAGVYGGYYSHQHYYPQSQQQIMDDSYSTNNGYEEENTHDQNQKKSNWTVQSAGGKVEAVKMMEMQSNNDRDMNVSYGNVDDSMNYENDDQSDDDVDSGDEPVTAQDNESRNIEYRSGITMSPVSTSKPSLHSSNDSINPEQLSTPTANDALSSSNLKEPESNTTGISKKSKGASSGSSSGRKRSQSEHKKRTTSSNSKNRTKKSLVDHDDDDDGGISSVAKVIGSKTLAGLFGASVITDSEYENAESMLNQFLQVPLLSEFIKPVIQLHPELTSLYSKIISKPMDLGHVCGKVRKRAYLNANSIRLDIWRIFSNCVAYHSNSSAKETAIPSFISVALHLREFFNALWLEYMLPSEIPLTYHQGVRKNKKEVNMAKEVFDQRDIARQARLVATSSTILSAKCLKKASQMLGQLVDLGGCVDGLDSEPCLSIEDEASRAFRSLAQTLKTKADDVSNSSYSMADLTRDMKACSDLVSDPESASKLNRRMDRIVGKLVVPLFEAGCRGVEQSSIWGCMAAAVWARENKKKPYWPGIVLGIVAPESQREEWHQALTDRNEGRLTNQLRIGLSAGKKKAEQHMKRQDQMSYFLVEFMGTHEFAWVKESDLLDNFNPDEDPNNTADATKKRSSRAIAVNAEQFSAAVEECRWALSEFERQVGDPCGDSFETELEEGVSLSYTSLSEMLGTDTYEDSNTNDSDYEAQELFENDGILDYSAAGRKKAKQKAAKVKKQKIDAIKAAEKVAKAKEAKAKKAKNPSSGNKKRKFDVEQGDSIKMVRPNSFVAALIPSEEYVPTTKKERAAFKVKEILRRIGRESGFTNVGLFTGGVVDSGLLAMALAFRSAAGEIPDPSGVITKPWEEIMIKGVKSSSERCSLLRKKIEILQNDIERVKAAKDRREQLLAEIDKENITREKKMKSLYKQNDSTSRRKQIKKGKKPVKLEEEQAAHVSDDDQSQEVTHSVVPVEEDHKSDQDDIVEVKSEQITDTNKIAETPITSRNEHELDAALLMASLSQVKVHDPDKS